MKKIISQLQNLGLFTTGVVAHHMGSKLLDYNQDMEELKEQEKRDSLIKDMSNNIETIKDHCEKISSEGVKILEKNVVSDYNINLLNKKIEEASKSKDILLKTWAEEKTKTSNIENNRWDEVIIDMHNKLEEVNRYITEIGKNGKNYISNINDLYKYLDNLSLLQELALLHILIICSIIFIIINILIVLLGNQIINYFNLEIKYPSLSTFFKLRITYQKYYLTWNIFLLFSLLLLGLGINILIIYTKA